MLKPVPVSADRGSRKGQPGDFSKVEQMVAGQCGDRRGVGHLFGGQQEDRKEELVGDQKNFLMLLGLDAVEDAVNPAADVGDGLAMFRCSGLNPVL